MKVQIPALASDKELVHLFGSTMGHVIRSEKDQGSSITVAIKPPYSPSSYSVTEFFVSPKFRNSGIGDSLIKAALKHYPKDIGAQCSSDESTRLFWKNGFRMLDESLTLNDALKVRKENSSVYLKKF